MSLVNTPITQVWANGISQTNGVQWITANPAGINDPRPINSRIGILFNTGAQLEINGFTIYFRGTDLVPILEGSLDTQTESALNGYSLSDVENAPAGLQSSPGEYAFSIQVNLQWGKFANGTGYIVSLANSLNAALIYQYNSVLSSAVVTESLNANSDYIFLVNAQDDAFTVSIYPVLSTGYLANALFTSAPIKDSSLFYRCAGNIGLQVATVDTGALVYSLRPYHTVFSVFESASYTSLTPVSGAQLYAQNTPPTQLFQLPLSTVSSSDNVTPVVTPDSGRTLSGTSQRITFGASTATTTYQGILTLPLTPYGDSISGITDYEALSASFDIWIESNALTTQQQPFIGLLVNEQGYGIPLILPALMPNQWNHGSINLLVQPNDTYYVTSQNTNTIIEPLPINGVIPSGLYRFCLLYTGSNATTIWLDNIQIVSNAVSWSARASAANPYDQTLSTWVPFDNTINSSAAGVRFDSPGEALQIKAEALQQDAEIYGGYTLVPSYATLGRPVFNTTQPSILNTGISVTSASLGGTTFVFTCDITVSPLANLYNIVWSFGDGNYAFDQWKPGMPSVTRTYTYQLGTPNTGQFYVNASIEDNAGNKGYGTTLVSV